MIAGKKVTSETKSASSQVSRHEPMTIKPIVKDQKIADMTLENLTKAIMAIQEGMKDNRPPPNTHMYPKREQQWCSVCLGPHSTSECPTFRAKFNGVCNTCGKYGHQSKDCLVLKRMLASRPPAPTWTNTPQVPAIMPTPPIEQSSQVIARTQNVVQSVPLPPPVLGPQPPHPRVTPMN